MSVSNDKLTISHMKISEIAKIVGTSVPLISKKFKSNESSQVTRANNRVIGVSPEAVEQYFKDSGLDFLYRGAVMLSANLCGGVGKTSTINNLGAALRRIVSRDTAIVYVDGDSQGSFTSTFFGEPARDNEPILIDFLDNKASIDDVLTQLSDNIWFVKSNLNQVFIDKVISKPQDIKNKMLEFYKAIFAKLGNQTKIFQDHTPQLSNLFASSICALHQLDKEIIKAVLIPIRADKYAIQGADYIIKEMSDLRDTYSFDDNIDIHCFFSNVDRRIPTTGGALQLATQKQSIVKHLSSVAVRFSTEIPKSIAANTNIFSRGKRTNATEDYQDLLQYILSYRTYNKD